MRTETLESITMWWTRGLLAFFTVLFLRTVTAAVAVRVQSGSFEPRTVSVAAKTGIGGLLIGTGVLAMEGLT